jgi:hypothetical protein
MINREYFTDKLIKNKDLLANISFKQLVSSDVDEVVAYIKDCVNEFEFNNNIQEGNLFNYKLLEEKLEQFFHVNESKAITVEAYIHYKTKVLTFHSSQLFQRLTGNSRGFYKALSSNHNLFKREEPFDSIHLFIKITLLSVEEPCHSCGSVDGAGHLHSGQILCILCKSKKAKREEPLITADGRILYGADKKREIEWEKKLEKKEQDIKDGKLFKCPSCKRYVKIEHKAKGKSGSCTSCIAKIMEEKEIERLKTNAEEIRKLKAKKANMSLEEKKQNAESEQDMIAKFLASKKMENA